MCLWWARGWRCTTTLIRSCEFSYYLRGFWFIFDGLAQAAGLGVALQSAFISTEPGPSRAPAAPGPAPAAAPPSGDPSRPAPAAPRDPGGSPSTPAPGKDLYWIPRPMPVGQSGFGVGVFGSF
ncbi:MAG: hypothetical protein U0165_04970 [Polyangiaceae bacterium]